MRVDAGPANLRLLSNPQLVRHLRNLARRLPRPDAIGIGMAGARTDADRRRLHDAAGKVWPRVPCVVTNDLEIALLTDEADQSPALRRKPPVAHVLVLSGTGSCCFGRTPVGKIAKVGGWGHLLGDKGSGYEIGLRALKAVVYYNDRDGRWPTLGQRILRKLHLNIPDDLIGWAQSAAKSEIAAVAVEVFAASHEHDRIAIDILTGAANSLANDAVDCARRLVKRGSHVRFVLAGGVLLKQRAFSREVTRLIRTRWPSATVSPLKHEAVWGAVELAKRQLRTLRPMEFIRSTVDRGSRTLARSPHALPSLESLQRSPTERRNPKSTCLDRMQLNDAIQLMLSEDARIPKAILAERRKISRLIGWIVRSLKRDGRLLYVGAGTSGRLGVLDASECPPTFRTPPGLVQGIIAGGQRALWESIEGAEDDQVAGGEAIAHRGVSSKDVVVGIAASGRTPFVWGALWEAKRRRAKSALLCFNPHLEIAPRDRPDLVIAPRIGPELLTGSTRLKAGTATKLVLNLLTTLSMVRMGKVASNLMIDLNPSNVKLRDRAVRIVRELTGASEEKACAQLTKSGWVVKGALRSLRWRSL
jgi:N-acetylmuramic acid 6-phosphate etherase